MVIQKTDKKPFEQGSEQECLISCDRNEKWGTQGIEMAPQRQQVHSLVGVRWA